MSTPTVSIIIPTLDAEATLSAALDSVLNDQTVSVEVLVVDDGSVDGTHQVVVDRQDERIRWLTTGARRSGSGVTRNIALAAAEGEWIGLLDADDVWAPGRLERLLEAGRRGGCRVVCDDLAVVVQGRQRTTLLQMRGLRERPEVWTIGLADLIRYDLGLFMPIFGREHVTEGGLRYPTYRCSTPDFALLFDLLAREGRAVVVNEPMYRYHKQSDSESAARPGFWLDSLRMTADVLQRQAADDPVIEGLLEKRMAASLAKYHYLMARQHLRDRRLLAGVRSLARSPGALGLAVAGASRRVGPRSRPRRRSIPLPVHRRASSGAPRCGASDVPQEP